MNAQGLLVEGAKGKKFVLTTEPHLVMKTHRLVVMQRLNGKWEHMKGIQELACREPLIGAFVDCFVDLCRVLNSPNHNPAAEVVPIRLSPARRARPTQPSLASGAATDRHDH